MNRRSAGRFIVLNTKPHFEAHNLAQNLLLFCPIHTKQSLWSHKHCLTMLCYNLLGVTLQFILIILIHKKCCRSCAHIKTWEFHGWTDLKIAHSNLICLPYFAQQERHSLDLNRFDAMKKVPLPPFHFNNFIDFSLLMSSVWNNSLCFNKSLLCSSVILFF